jgi:predicted RNA-binding Zn-ribbon protein involved in translation (DUF1610 family)
MTKNSRPMQDRSGTPCDRYHGFAFLRWRKPCDMPMAYWRRAQPYRWALAASCVVVAVLGAFSLYFVFVLAWYGWGAGNARIAAAPIRPSWFPPIVAVAVLTMEVLKRSLRRRYRRFVVTRNGSACTNCGYDLTGLPAEHLCPECGERYNIQHVRQQWDDWFGNGASDAEATGSR